MNRFLWGAGALVGLFVLSRGLSSQVAVVGPQLNEFRVDGLGDVVLTAKQVKGLQKAGIMPKGIAS